MQAVRALSFSRLLSWCGDEGAWVLRVAGAYVGYAVGLASCRTLTVCQGLRTITPSPQIHPPQPYTPHGSTCFLLLL